MPSRATFEERYGNLNPAQKKAVDTIEGPVLVVAGPGSGKTEILSLRVANILRRTDTHPGSILCLTFTDSASVNMRSRLAGLIGTDSYRVHVHTFHSFGVSIINRFPEYFFGSAEFNPADSVTQIETLSALFKELSYDNPLRSEHPEQGFVFLQSTLSAISHIKRAGLSPSELRDVLEHNALVLEYITPLIASVFSDRLSKKDFPRIKTVLADIVHAHTRVSKKFPVSHMKPVSDAIARSLAEALAEAEEEDKTAPLSRWKSSWTEARDEKERGGQEGGRVLKDLTRLPRMYALADMYRDYQASLFSQGYYDFDDMLLQTIHAIEHTPSLALTLQEEYQYILVDEFQDTNDAQMRLLRLLTSAAVHEGRPNIMAVGDDDQAIYKFQGAEVANMLQFKEMYRDPVVVTLSENYRSTQAILDLAEAVISQGSKGLQAFMPEIEKKLKASNIKLGQDSEGNIVGEIISKTFRTDLHEFQYIAREVRRRMDEGIPPDSIAIISRTHSILQSLVPYLHQEGIPVEYDKQQNVLELGYIRELITIARFVASVASHNQAEADELLPVILSYPWWGLPRKLVWNVSTEAHDKRLPWLSVMEDHPDTRVRAISMFLISLGVLAESEPVERILDMIIGSKTLELPDSTDDDADEDVIDDLTVRGFESPFRDYYFGKNISTHKGQYLTFLSGLRVFIQTLREYKQGRVIGIRDLVEMVDVYEKNNMSLLDTSPFMTGTHSVRLLTAHKAKGLEFEVVFVVSTTDDVWTTRSRGDMLPFPKNLPIKPSLDTKDDILRLLYVALTRAKHTLYMTSYEQNSKGSHVLPVEFLNHISRETSESDTEKNVQDTAVEHPLVLAWSTLTHGPFETDEAAMLKSIVEGYQMPVTHFNNFLDVTKGGPAIFLEQNLLRFPQAKTPASIYGTAMHAVIQYMYTYLRREGGVPALTRVLEVLKKQIDAGRLSVVDTRIQYERGEKALTLYYAEKKDTFDPLHRIEVDFKHQGVAVGEACITGKIDKMVMTGSEIVVYDFKTGKVRLSWEGTDSYTSLQLHHYAYQLLYYKILVEHSKEFREYHVSTGVLEFLESYKGALVELPLVLADTDIARLTELIQIVYKKICALDFPDVTKYSQDFSGCIEFEEDLLSGSI